MNTQPDAAMAYVPPKVDEVRIPIVGLAETPLPAGEADYDHLHPFRPTPLSRLSEMPRERVGIGAHLLPAIIVLCMPISTFLITMAYSEAATGDASQKHFDLFWLGLFIFLVPASLRMCGRSASRNERLALLVAGGSINILPKFLTTPSYFLYHDELAHWRQAELIHSTGRLFLPNPSVYISQYFPGLESMTVALRDLTDLTTFQVATVLLLATHFAVLVGIFLIGETLTNSTRVGAVAAFIYSLNPGFMYFDSQYSYESIAFVYVVWVIVAVVKMQALRTDRGARQAWFALGLVLAGTCIVTHHVSSYFLIGILWLIYGASIFDARRDRRSRLSSTTLGLFCALVTLGAVGWLIFVAPDVITYLTQPFNGALAQFEQILQHKQQSRVVFSGSNTPKYEHYSAFGSVLFGLAGLAGGVVILRGFRTRSSAHSGLAVFGLLYFGTLPLVLTGAGSEGVHRSWTFTYIGLSLLTAPAVVALKELIEGWSLPRRWITSGILVGCFCVMQVGNVGMNTDEYYRFPGPYVFGSDTRSTTAELLDMAAWLRVSQGPGKDVVADYFVSNIVSSFSLDWTPLATPGFPVWQLYFDPKAPSAFLLHELEFSKYQYLIVDERMAKYLPYLGIYFSSNEVDPNGQSIAKPPSASVINRFSRLPWAIRIYQSDNFSVYRLNYTAMNVAWSFEGAADSTSARPKSP